MASSLGLFLMEISHGEDAVSFASAANPKLRMRLLTDSTQPHIAGLRFSGQAHASIASAQIPQTTIYSPGMTIRKPIESFSRFHLRHRILRWNDCRHVKFPRKQAGMFRFRGIRRSIDVGF
jgi:hypothetical protein